MKVPSTHLRLAGGLNAPVQEIRPEVFQAHLVKHVLGIAYVAKKLPWQREGWHVLDPQVVNESSRTSVMGLLMAMRHAGASCAVPEIAGTRGRSDPDDLACYRCGGGLALECQRISSAGDGPGARYTAVTEALLAALSEPNAIAVRRAQFSNALVPLWGKPDTLASLVVLTVGVADRNARQAVARVTREDGVRAEFYLDGKTLRWRTTYRELPSTAPVRISYLLDFARPPDVPNALSDLCLVPRPWWERHGR
jgi:hypothetical protein